MRNKDKTANEKPLRCIEADAETSGVQTDTLVMAFNRPPTETPRRIVSFQRSRKEQNEPALKGRICLAFEYESAGTPPLPVGIPARVQRRNALSRESVQPG